MPLAAPLAARVLILFLSVFAHANFLLPFNSFGVPGTSRTFDYVVVGGGTAGLTMAYRLAESGTYSVAVIEAGGFYEIENGNRSVVPAFATYYAGSALNDTAPQVDWGFQTTPQAGANNRVMHYAQGKTLGGSSSRNFMAYHRPTVDSMQRWADEVGDASYTFAQVLPYYEKSVQFNDASQGIQPNASNLQTGAGFSATGGPLHVSYPHYVDAFATWVRLGLQSLGMKSLVNGFNSGTLIGSAWMTWTIDPLNSHRSSAEATFLRSAFETTTLQVYTHTLTQKVIFGADNTATGVMVTTEGTYGTESVDYVLEATREIIVSAGAIQSPQLLMVSGIGPAATLERYGIQVLKDAPGVGQNLQDQPMWGISNRVNMPTTSALLNNPAQMNAATAAWIQNVNGPLAEYGPGYFGWEKLPANLTASFSKSTLQTLASFPSDWPEAEYMPINAYTGYNTNYQTADPRDGTNYATIAACMVAASSIGNMTISGSQMSDPPVINPNWLTNPADVELAVGIFQRQRQIWAELDKLGVTVGPEVLPGPAVQDDAQILNYIHESVIQSHHVSATCKMGRANDTMAVVDSQGRVYGTQGLRVVNASIFPFLPPGHPQSTVYMLAEKIATDILNA